MHYNIDYINQLISDRIEESNSLEYKSSDSLNKTDSCKKEIAKDVSAFANANGGIIIYGIKEYNELNKRHLPEKITPIKRDFFSKESLEQIINQSISPKIEGLRIFPIELEFENEVIYVVEIPKSTTAHQNLKDRRYHRRYNFEVLDMFDYEIRDVMNRRKNPQISLHFKIEKITYKINENDPFRKITTNLFQFPGQEEPSLYSTFYNLLIFQKNESKVIANFVKYFVLIPLHIFEFDEVKHLEIIDKSYLKKYGDNTIRDYISGGGQFTTTVYGPSRFDPILPDMNSAPNKMKLVKNPNLNDDYINWEVYADNSEVIKGQIRLSEIEIIEKLHE